VTFGRSDDYIAGIRILRADRSRCVICGHPTGDCTGETQAHVKVFGPGIFQSLLHEEVFIVEEDVWEEKVISSSTTTKVLLHPKGTAIPLSEAQRLGLC
jgi:hypothetical protein